MTGARAAAVGALTMLAAAVPAPAHAEVFVGPPADRVVTLHVGSEATCVLRMDGGVRCWGRNDDGGLGLGTRDRRDHFAPTSVDLPAVRRLTFGVGRTYYAHHGLIQPAKHFNIGCAELADDGVACWGLDPWDLYDKGRRPVAIPALRGLRGLALGDGVACALDGGEVKCWGNGPDFGSGSRKPRRPPEAIARVEGAVQLACATRTCCARLGSAEVPTAPEAASCPPRAGAPGGVVCWDAADGPTPRVSPIRGAVDVSWIAYGYGLLWIVSGGTVAYDTRRGKLTAIEGVSDAVTVAAGRFGTCAVDSAGGVSCWRVESSYADTPSQPAARVALPAPATEVQVGTHHACALLEDGRVACWGGNRRGQLGDGTVEDRADPVIARFLDRAPEVPIATPDLRPEAAAPWPREGPSACRRLAAPQGANFDVHAAFALAEHNEGDTFDLTVVLADFVVPGGWEDVGQLRGGQRAVELRFERRRPGPGGGELARPRSGRYTSSSETATLVETVVTRSGTLPHTRGQARLAVVGPTHVCGTFALETPDGPIAGRFTAPLDADGRAAVRAARR